jgi:hypothetical protein
MAHSALKQATAKCNFTSMWEYPLHLPSKEKKMERNIPLFRANIFVDSNCHTPTSDGILLFTPNSMFKEKVIIFQKLKATEALFIDSEYHKELKF